MVKVGPHKKSVARIIVGQNLIGSKIQTFTFPMLNSPLLKGSILLTPLKIFGPQKRGPKFSYAHKNAGQNFHMVSKINLYFPKGKLFSTLRVILPNPPKKCGPHKKKVTWAKI